MTYQKTLDWMFAQLPMYQRHGQSAFKKDLNNITEFSNRLNNPQNTYKTIHVGGTNGKGSTSHMLASVLQEAGYKVGLYTSPHLIDFRERIKVNGKMASKEYVINFIKEHQSFFEKNLLSFFEMTVGMAFQYFKDEQVDVAIIEVGLGGRLDSTNIINPIVSIITNISLDHTNMLGEDIASIAYEKAGIIKKNIPVVVGEKGVESDAVFIEKAKLEAAKIIFAEDLIPKHNFISDLKGNYQLQNIRTVLVALDSVSKYFNVEVGHIKKGLNNVVDNTGFLGRWQILSEKPLIISDTGHNEAAIKEIVAQLQSLNKKQLHCVLGFVNDKEVDKMLKWFPDNANFYFAEPSIPRKMKLDDLKKQVSKSNVSYYGTVLDALNKSKGVANEEDVIFVGGSTFVVAEIL